MSSRKNSSVRAARSMARGKPWWFVGLMILVTVWVVVRFSGELPVPPPEPAPAQPAGAVAESFVLKPEEEVFAGYAGSASCRGCHQSVYDLWGGSNHGLAERAPDRERDGVAFVPERHFRHGSQESRAGASNAVYEVTTLGLSGQPEAYQVERVIGADPLRQFLVSAPGGRLQTLEVAYDPHTNEWFDVYGGEDRQPGEWGHWTGRGMTWNSMCAACHNTRLRKNYDVESDTYDTAMAEMSVGCEACHGPMKDHVEWRQAYPGSTERDPTLSLLSTNQVLETCGSCHSRRSELTGDFHPGELFSDHFSLLLPDETDIYYADGQVQGENYVFGSFLSSAMHGAGVSCRDCHDPHSARTIAPGNLLCLRCHSGGDPKSPLIDPVKHSFHNVEGPGGQCVSCHMPRTTYMQRHQRRDHGFTIPDPLLTRELGIPTACNRCHTDRDTDWAVAAVEKWYGPRMERATRERARRIAAVRSGEDDARDRILAMLEEEKSAFWQGVAVGLLDRWVYEPRVSTALLATLEHESPLVRGSAVRTLEPLAQQGVPNVVSGLRRLLEDPVRMVRVHAGWALRDRVPVESLAHQELLHYLNHNADQPTGLLQVGLRHLARREMDQAVASFGKAVAWDPNSAPLRHEYAVVLSMQGNAEEALKQMSEACRLEPKVAEYHYKLGLAWNEMGDAAQTAAALERAVVLEPGHARAWYNLGLARSAAQDWEGALAALLRAESADERDPRIPYARATVLAQMERMDDARSAAARALEIRPDYSAARQFLEQHRSE